MSSAPTVQADSLAGTIKLLSAEELLLLAQTKRAQLVEAGVIDSVSNTQPAKPPACDSSLVGAKLEINWRHWVVDKVTGRRSAVLMWCQGEVVLVANGTTDKEKETASCRKLAAVGTVRIKWPADKEFEEEEMFVWSILMVANWNAQRHMIWRFAPSELETRMAAAAEAKRHKLV